MKVEANVIVLNVFEDFDAVVFLEVEAIAVLPIIVNDVESVDHLGDIELEASIDISSVIVDEVEAVDLWKSRPAEVDSGCRAWTSFWPSSRGTRIARWRGFARG